MKKTDIKQFFHSKKSEQKPQTEKNNQSFILEFENNFSDASEDDEFKFEAPSINLLSFYGLQKDKNSENSTTKIYSFISEVQNKNTKLIVEEAPANTEPFHLNQNLWQNKPIGFSTNKRNTLNEFFAPNSNLISNLIEIPKKKIKTNSLDCFVIKKRVQNKAKM